MWIYMQAELEDLFQSRLEKLGRDLGDLDETLLQLLVVRVVGYAVLHVLCVALSKSSVKF